MAYHVCMGKQTNGNVGNWTWNAAHPKFGSALVHSGDTMIIVVYNQTMRRHAGMAYLVHEAAYLSDLTSAIGTAEDEMTIETRMSSHLKAACLYLAAREGVGDYDQLAAACQQLWAVLQ